MLISTSGQPMALHVCRQRHGRRGAAVVTYCCRPPRLIGNAPRRAFIRAPSARCDGAETDESAGSNGLVVSPADHQQQTAVTPPEDDRNTSSIEDLAEKLAQRRLIKETGIRGGVAFVGLGLLLLGLTDSAHEGHGNAIVELTGGLLLLLGVGAPWIIGNRQVQVGDVATLDILNGRYYLQAGARPSYSQSVQDGDVAVRETGDARGRGAYAKVDIPAGSFVNWYDGEYLDTKGFYTRYPDGVADYCMVLDEDTVIDAAEISRGDNFTAGHVNHSRTRHNVARWYDRPQQRIFYYTTKDIKAGGELLIDYGRTYWIGREHLEME